MPKKQKTTFAKKAHATCVHVQLVANNRKALARLCGQAALRCTSDMPERRDERERADELALTGAQGIRRDG